ncbi:hypothetical protein N657DRAFT_648005 [Parathielavia appendiculata]|uniref:Zn(2)-C6 fungal-type domain-containing protein n=1 Tax=Parathielavia appendiculata TaxID=2587402 RepID=A0AAN6TVC6_9PEZI|nr:hypothetical protein N657DRAFT_648005 [Parathielavia appendiculata]
MEAEQTPLRLEGEGSRSGSTATSQLSCAQCRNRKLRCDRKFPRCERCVQLGETCNYPEARQRALGRRRTVRELETRIEELEALLRAANLNNLRQNEETESDSVQRPQPLFQEDNNLSLDLLAADPPPLYQDLSLENMMFPAQAAPGFLPQSGANQLFGLSLFEQLPSWEVIDELTTLYFQNIHAGAPMLHQTSYTAALRLPPHMRPPMCLQYIVMASAAATSQAYRHLSEPFYQRARVYAEADELKGQGETFTTLGHVQAWCLISAYECHVYAIFTRASTSLCRAVRIAQMLKLHRLDLLDPQGQDQLQSGLPRPRTWIEAEERRRTWWVAFMADRFLSSITGWPSLIKERHVRTTLPSTEEAFIWGIKNEAPIPLSKALRALQQQSGAQPSPFAIRILAANELLHVLDHTAHHPPDHKNVNIEDMLNGSYWRRHRELDSNLTTLTLFLPESLQLSHNPRSLDAILVHTCTHMAIIQLHRVALGLLHQNHSTISASANLIAESQARKDSAAQGILAVFRTAGEEGLGRAIRNPLLSFAAYMAALVFLEHCVSASQGAAGGEGGGGGAGRHESEDALNFLTGTLVFYAKGSPLVRANAFQLAMDMKRAGYDSSMMDSVMNQIETLGGTASEIQVQGSNGRPMLFCPALTSTLDSDEGTAFVLQGTFGL